MTLTILKKVTIVQYQEKDHSTFPASNSQNFITERITYKRNIGF